MGTRPGNRESPSIPPVLEDLLSARDETAANHAWERFLEVHSDLILRTARSVTRDRDAAMDAYAFVLERLHADDFDRLRKFDGGDRDHLSRWLVVVCRRLSLDLHRRKYGRPREHTPERERQARKRLVDELWEDRDPTELPDPRGSNPEMNLRRTELTTALDAALADLEPRDQLLLALRFDNGLTGRRIAEILALPSPFHVYRRLNKALARVRTHLEARGFLDPRP